MQKREQKLTGKVDGGYIILARQILESDIFFDKPAEWFKIWIYILLKVNYENGRRFPRGCGYFNWEEDKRNLKGVKKWQWHNCIRFLKTHRMLATHKTTRGNVIKVLKYDIYQNPDIYKSKTKNKARATHEQHTSNTILKELKKERIKEKISCPKNKYRFSDEHLSLASYLIKLILENKADYHFTGNNYKEKWANEIRLMVERDNRKVDKIKEAITFSQRHHFWKKNILSADKLRSQFDRLEMEMKEEGGTRDGKSRQIIKHNPREGWEESEKYREIRKK